MPCPYKRTNTRTTIKNCTVLGANALSWLNYCFVKSYSDWNCIPFSCLVLYNVDLQRCCSWQNQFSFKESLGSKLDCLTNFIFFSFLSQRGCDSVQLQSHKPFSMSDHESRVAPFTNAFMLASSHSPQPHKISVRSIVQAIAITKKIGSPLPLWLVHGIPVL